MQMPRWQAIKRLTAPRLDIPFSRDDANLFLPWIIVLMVFLTGLFLAVGITVGEIVTDKKTDIARWVTIQVPATHADQQGTAEKIRLMLSEQDGIADVTRLSESEVVTLLSPWFGKGLAAEALPLPVIVEAQLDEDGSLEQVRKNIAAMDPTIEIDDHAEWMEQYLDFISLLEGGAYLLALMIIAATTVIIVFTSKTALKLHKDAIWLLHSVGAADEYIARQFQFNAFLLGMRGALIGTVLAAVLFFALGILTSQFEAPLLPTLPVTGWHLFMWLFLPLATGLLAMFVARKTVLAMLLKLA